MTTGVGVRRCDTRRETEAEGARFQADARDEGGSRAETDVVVVVCEGGRHSHGSTGARVDGMQQGSGGSKGW